MPWMVTVRTGGRVESARFAELEPALQSIDARLSELAESAPRRPVDVRYRQFEPSEQVHARIELAGPERLLPRVRAGVDVRGDGSSAPYLGRIKRQPLDRRAGESAATTLRRVLLS